MNYSILRIVATIFTIVLLFSFLFTKSKSENKLKYNSLILITTFLFTLTSTISALVNSDIELMLGTMILFVIFLTFNVVFPSLTGIKSNELIYKSILYSHIPVIFIPLVRGVGISSYRGIFENPNSFGIVCVTLFAALVSKLANSIHGYIFYGEQIKKRQLLFYFIVLPSVLMLTIYSGSRTSFITAAGILLTACGLITLRFLKHTTKRQFFNGVRLGLFLMALSLITSFVFPIKEKFDGIILRKFQLKASDTLSERGYVWDRTIEQSSIFGHGRDYFAEFKLGAHNTFISLWGQYGWLPTALFIIVMISFLFISIRYSFKANSDPYRFMPVLMMIAFLMLSVGEGMLFKGTMFGAFASAGAATVMIKNQQVRMDKEIVIRKKRRFKRIVWN